VENHITEIKIGATTYTVERVFGGNGKETALDIIKRLMLQNARRKENNLCTHKQIK